jgi:hypothetical protein
MSSPVQKQDFKQTDGGAEMKHERDVADVNENWVE